MLSIIKLFNVLIFYNSFFSFNVKCLTDDNKYFSIDGYELYHFNSSIILEKIFSNNFKILNIDISYNFSKFNLHNEKQNSEVSVFVKLVNKKKEVLVESVIFVIENTVKAYYDSIIGIDIFPNTTVKIIQLDKMVSFINSQNKTRPLKIEKLYVTSNTSMLGQMLREHLDHNMIFDSYLNYNLKYNIKIYDNMIISNYVNIVKIPEVENVINSISTNLKNINSSLNKKLFLYLRDINKNSSINISIFIRSTYNIYEIINSKHFSGFEEVIQKIKNSDFEDDKFLNFSMLLKIFNVNENIGRNISNLIFSYNRVSVIFEINEIFSIEISFNNKETNTRFIDFIYSKKLEDELEKLALSEGH